MLGPDPRRYLRDVLEAIPRATNQDVENLTPYNWSVSKNLFKAIGSAA